MKYVIFMIYLLSPAVMAQEIMIADMERHTLDDWQHKIFAGETDYQIIKQDGRHMLRAISEGGASGIVIERSIDLTQTPYLNWQWRIDAPLEGLSEQSKAGDDYAARIYVVVSGGLRFWKSKALNYVWSGSQPVGTYWDNAYTSQAKMVAVESGVANSDQWRTYKRNILEDMQKLFDEEVTHIDAIAIMTDTDNSQQQATAYYGNISFSSE